MKAGGIVWIRMIIYLMGLTFVALGTRLSLVANLGLNAVAALCK